MHGLVADYLEPGAPDATAWPIFRSRTGARDCGWDTASGRRETGEEEGSSGQSTALTRRGLTVVLLS